MNLEKENICINKTSTISHKCRKWVDLKISELAKIIAKVVNYNGEIKFDNNKPDERQES